MEKVVVKNLKYKYPMNDKLVLDDISFAINEGEFVGVVGRNSSGKSTLCQAIVGLIPHFYKGAYGGNVVVDGMEILKTDLSDIVTKVGIVFQNPFTQITGAKLTVYEEISFGLENLGIPREEMKVRINKALKLLDIYEYKDRNPFELSGGQMQRVAIASVIAMEPEIIVLDEPTSQLDPKGAEEVYKSIQNLSREGKTIIMVDHNMERLSKYSDRIMLLSYGKIVAFDIPSKIFSRDDLSKYGIKAPIFSELCKGLNLRNENTGLYPVTLEETYSLAVKHIERNTDK